MEWKLIGSGSVPTGFEHVQIDENNLFEHREILRALTIKAVEVGTIKLYKPKSGDDSDDSDDEFKRLLQKDRCPYERPMDCFKSKEYLDRQKEYKKDFEEDFFKSLEDESQDVKKELEKQGLTPLILMAMQGTAEGCKKLISEGAEIDKMSKVEPMTPMSEDENNDIYEEHKNFDGCTALMMSAFAGDVENFKYLMSAGADVSKETPAESCNGGFTALHYASVGVPGDQLEICKLLISAGADVNKETKKGITPLMYAAKNSKLELCKLLVSVGADIHKESNMGWTPLMFGASGESRFQDEGNSYWETCKFFIDAGADVNKKSKDGLDVFMIALNNPESSGIGKFCSKLALLEPDMPKNAVLDTNALANAAGKGCTDICEMFIMLGADVDKEHKDGWTPLMKAVYNDKYSTCELLISSGANVNKEVLLDKEPKFGSRFDDRDYMSLPKEEEMDPKSPEPTTALMLAVNNGSRNMYGERIAKLLLKAGANTDKIPKEKLEMLKEKSDGFNSPTNLNEDKTSEEDKDKEETPIYATCQDIDEAENLEEACDLKINKSDDNAMASLLEKCKSLVSDLHADLDYAPPLPLYYEPSLALMNAAEHGYTEICKMLIKAGINVDIFSGLNGSTGVGSTALLNAAESGHTEICQMLIAAEAIIEHKNMRGDSALSLAMYYHHIETCRALIAAGAPIPHYNEEIESDWNTTALMYAARTNMTEICDLLLTTMGVNIEEEDLKGETALMKAAEDGAADACRFLISKGASIEKENKDGVTALMKASWNVDEYIDVYKELISGGANVDKQDSNGLTVLMKTHNPKICQLFISAGANVNLQDANGQTALMKTMVWNGTLDCAGITEKPEICQLLISGGADLNLQDSNGETALMKAAKEGLVNTCEILITAGADVTIETSEKSDVRGYTALHFAAQPSKSKDHYKEIVKMLISAGANIDHESAEGWTPLMVGAKPNYSWKMCRELILGGADVNKKSKDGWTPLMITINKEHRRFDGDKAEVCSMLIKLGADITTETMPNGKTMLSCAASNDELYDVCEILLLRGADVNKEDKDGWTPLMKAACEKNTDIFNLLLAAGANAVLSTIHYSG